MPIRHKLFVTSLVLYYFILCQKRYCNGQKKDCIMGSLIMKTISIFYFQIISYCAVIATLIIPSGGGFLLHDDCPAPAPCTCWYQGIVDCSDKGLTSIPVFGNSSDQMTVVQWILELQDNHLTAIPSNSFANLQSFSNGKNITIRLDRNSLEVNSFNVNAFRGIENSVTSLYLDSNKLTSIPLAIGTLTHLGFLQLQNNPITNFDGLLSIRNSLTDLLVSLQSVTRWPNVLHYLTKLKSLFVTQFSYNIPRDAFRGFRKTLMRLEISEMAFTTIPSSVCDLKNLEELKVGGIPNLNGRHLITCNAPLYSVYSFVLNNKDMMTFPNVFRIFPNLMNMWIIGSSISYVDDFFVPNNTKIGIFEITDSNMTTVPGAVNKLSLLDSCRIQRNSISSIERHSIENLYHLKRLSLDNNPIIFISREAFWNLPQLSYIGLSGTLLTTVPFLVEALPSLNHIALAGVSVFCDCEFPHMNSNLLIDGNCDLTNETINHFVNTSLPLCP